MGAGDSQRLFTGLSYQLALFLSLGFLYSLARPLLQRLQPRLQAGLSGFLFGAMSILGMLKPIQLAPGFLVDNRAVVLALAGVFGGTGSALVAGAIATAFRSWVGGVGVLPGVGAILTASLLGVWAHWRWRMCRRNLGGRQFLLLGAGLAGSAFVWTMTLSDFTMAKRLLEIIVLPISVMYPLATLLLGTLLSHESRRQEAESALERAYVELEQRVAERTTELSRTNTLLKEEIAERERAEEVLRESESRYRSLFENSLDGILLTAPDGRILTANPEACRIFGCTEEELRQVGRAGVVDATDPWLPVLLDERARRGKSRGELTFLRRDGTGFPAEVSSMVFTDRDGTLKTSMLVRDITERKRSEEALRESEARYRLFFEASPLPKWLFDPATLAVLDVNNAAVEHYGYSRQEFLAMTIKDVRPPEEVTKLIAAFQGEVPPHYHAGTWKHRKKDGTLIDVDVHTHEVILGGHRLRLAVLYDITDQKRAEKALRSRTEQLETIREVTTEITQELDFPTLLGLVIRRAVEIVGAATGTVFLWDEGTRLLVPRGWHALGDWAGTVSLRVGEGVAGTVAARREGLIVNDFRHSPYALPVFLERTQTAAVLGEPILYRERLLGVITVSKKEDGGAFTEDDRHIVNLFAAQAAIAIENGRLFQEVRQQREQLRGLSAQLAETEESQHRQLARELHDQVGQNLTAIGINLNILRSQLPEDADASSRGRLDDSVALIEQTTARVRGVMAELRPPVLDDYGLLAAIRWYGAQFTSRTGIPVEVQGEESSPRLAGQVENALFRIVQEALTNVTKHARATRVTVTTRLDVGCTQLVIADDGVGFEPVGSAHPQPRRGWGLIGMRERAEALGGSCHVESRSGGGTRVVVEIGR